MRRIKDRRNEAGDLLLRTSERIYRCLLRLYPEAFRNEYGHEMVQCFRDAARDEVRNGGTTSLAKLCGRTLRDLIYTSAKERTQAVDGSVRGLIRAIVVVGLATTLILMVPLIGMAVSNEVVWDAFDFAVAGILLFSVGLTFTLVVRSTSNLVYRAAVALTLGSAFLLVWINLAVGMIGTEVDRANLMYLAVLATIIVGTIGSRFHPSGVIRTLLLAASLHVVIMAIALIGDLGAPVSHPIQIIGVNSMFVVLFIASAALFRFSTLVSDWPTIRSQN